MKFYPHGSDSHTKHEYLINSLLTDHKTSYTRLETIQPVPSRLITLDYFIPISMVFRQHTLTKRVIILDIWRMLTTSIFQASLKQTFNGPTPSLIRRLEISSNDIGHKPLLQHPLLIKCPQESINLGEHSLSSAIDGQGVRRQVQTSVAWEDGQA